MPELNVIKYRKLFYFISGLAVLASVISIFLFGFKFSIDFTGGSLLEGKYKILKPSKEKIQQELKIYKLGDVVLQTEEKENSLVLKFKNIDESTHQKIKNSLNELGIKLKKGNTFQEERFESIGPSIGSELKKKSIIAIILVLLLIILFIAYAFRKVSYPIKSWRYGVAALLALFHDILIPLGVLSILSYYYKSIEFHPSFIAAYLTILGFSVNDTIVVFDRIRENLFRNAKINFGTIINKSINQTLFRSINTSLTVLLTLAIIYIISGSTLKYFSLILIIGIAAGTYSSIFLASPLLFSWLNKKLKKT